MLTEKEKKLLEDLKEALNLTEEEAWDAAGVIGVCRLLIHDIREADSDPEGKYSSEVISEILDIIQGK